VVRQKVKAEVKVKQEKVTPKDKKARKIIQEHNNAY
jgi:hypothetical protein